MSAKYAILNGKEPITKDGYVTIISHVSSPSGMGEFEISVSGQLQAVLGYQKQAKILKLEIQPLTDVQHWHDLALQKALDAHRQKWFDRLEEVKKFIASATLAELNDPNLICHYGQSSDLEATDQNVEEDLSKDRLIEIRPLDNLDPKLTYLLSFTIDPSVSKGNKDIYRPIVQGADAVSARIDVSMGDADLVLYRAGRVQDESHSRGSSDSVFGDNGGIGRGNWTLHVIGHSDSTYEISGDWTL